MQAEWRNPNDIKKEFPSTSLLKENRIVFNINGNDYRLIVKINYDFGIVWIRFVATHQQYDKLNATVI